MLTAGMPPDLPEPRAFTPLTLTHPNGSRVTLYRYGAQVTSWIDVTGREQLFLSRRSRFQSGSSIRGGIPVVFPQFADSGPLPKHGLLRKRIWTVTRHDDISITLRTQDDTGTRVLWPYRFLAELTVTLDDALTVVLTITNTDPSPFFFTAALHNYFHTDEIQNVRVDGLSGCRYRDKVRHGVEVVDPSPELEIRGETDRIYQEAPRDVRITHTAGSHGLVLHATGFGDWVVWNPWAELTQRLADLEPEDYRRMLCVEAAHISTQVTLIPGERWSGTQVLRAI